LVIKRPDGRVSVANTTSRGNLDEEVRREVAYVIVSYGNGAIMKPAVPPAVSLSSKAERERSVRSLLTTTLNTTVASETVRHHWYLLASRRIGG